MSDFPKRTGMSAFGSIEASVAAPAPAGTAHEIHNEACGCVPMPAPVTIPAPAGRSESAAEDVLRKHPLQYGFRNGEIILNTADDPDPTITDRMNRCPECEEWSPCSVRRAFASLRAEIVALRERNATLARDHSACATEISGLTDALRKIEREVCDGPCGEIARGALKGGS